MAEWNQCFYCGRTLNRREITADHVEPSSIGGEKMVTSCRECNNTKGFETLDWFREFLGVERFFGEKRGWKSW